MAVTSPSIPSRPEPTGVGRSSGGGGVEVARQICPYLLAPDGGWRSVVASRDQQCGAIRPPAALALDKQRRLCITDHGSCATYLAASEGASAIAHAAGGGVTRWSLVRTAPVVLDEGRIASVGRLARRRTAPQMALGGLMALALVAVVVARLPGPGPSMAGAVASSTPDVTTGPSRAPARTSTAETASPRPAMSSTPATPRVSAGASPSVRPTAVPSNRTYRVRAGDTLYAIAIRFNTTVQAIVDENGLRSTALRIGQQLELP